MKLSKQNKCHSDRDYWCKGLCKQCYSRGYRKQYNIIKKNDLKAYNQLYFIKNKDAVTTKCKQYHERTKEIRKYKKRANSRDWYSRNKAHCNQHNAEYVKQRCKIDPKFKITRILRVRLIRALQDQYTNKQSSMHSLLGCSVSELKMYLSEKFKIGMTWENYNHKTWHVDHIKPCSKFDLTKEEEQKKCFHYSNLQPLWAYENLSKGSKYTVEPQDVLVGNM